jgi:Secretion system C-terminal sorting domain
LVQPFNTPVANPKRAWLYTACERGYRVPYWNQDECMPVGYRDGAQPTLVPAPFSVSPNPANDYVRINFGEKLEGSTTITLTDLSGRQVKSIQVPNSNQYQDMYINDCSNGLYILTIKRSNEAVFSQKLSIIH